MNAKKHNKLVLKIITTFLQHITKMSTPVKVLSLFFIYAVSDVLLTQCSGAINYVSYIYICCFIRIFYGG